MKIDTTIIFKYCFLLGLLFFFTSCQNEKKNRSRQQIVEDYFAELNRSNIAEASKFVSPDILGSELEFIQVSNKEDWFRQFRWDSVFNPKYKILEISESEEKVEATISKKCRRIQYLHDGPIVVKVSFEFRNNLISKDHTFEFLKFDFEKWQSRRDSLVSWIDDNHPELSGFIYDQTVKGGQDYLFAIELYQKAKPEN